MKHIGHLNDYEYSQHYEIISNLKDVFQDFNESLHNRLEVDTAKISELSLIITAILTIWIVILETNKEFFKIWDGILLTMVMCSFIIPIWYWYFYYQKKIY